MDDYSHWFVVADLAHRPGKAAVEAVHGVLHRWGLVTGKPALFDASGRVRARIPNDEVARASALPTELILEYEAATGPQVAALLGKGPAGPIEHVKTTACFGASFRVLESHATLEVGLDETRLVDRCPVTEQRRFPGDAAPPVVRVTVLDPRTGTPLPTPPGFRGVMRAGVRLQPGWVPSWVEGLPRERARWPDPRLGRELEEAIGAPLVQLGLLE